MIKLLSCFFSFLFRFTLVSFVRTRRFEFKLMETYLSVQILSPPNCVLTLLITAAGGHSKVYCCGCYLPNEAFISSWRSLTGGPSCTQAHISVAQVTSVLQKILGRPARVECKHITRYTLHSRLSKSPALKLDSNDVFLHSCTI